MGKGGQVEMEEGRRSLERVRGPRYEGCVNKKSKWFEVVTQAGFKWVPSRIKLVTRGSRLDISGSKLASGWPK